MENNETWSGERSAEVGFELRNPKPETDSEDLTSPGPTETRNPKPTLKTYTFPRTDRNPKPETDCESWFRTAKPETRHPKPTLKT